MQEKHAFSTDLLHGDDNIEQLCDVSPAIHLSTTFAYTKENEPRDAIYSRESIPTVQRCEAVLSKILTAPCVAYSSGLSAIHAILIYLNPKRIYLERAEKGGYHGTIGIAKTMSNLTGMKIYKLDDLEDEDHNLNKGDLIWLESPLNPTGEITDISKYAKIASKSQAILAVDATFAPPPLQNPFDQGADWVMHSATKYFCGHSDLLAGVAASRNSSAIHQLQHDRVYLGTIPSGHTAWLLLRSLRTYDMRIARQTTSAGVLVKRFNELIPTKILKVAHSSLQDEEYVEKQMTGGHSPTFSVYFHSEQQAAKFPNLLKLFYHATSFGGVESLAEWRAMSDSQCDKRLVRISVGVEDVDDLWQDISQALTASQPIER